MVSPITAILLKGRFLMTGYRSTKTNRPTMDGANEIGSLIRV